jgi:hypothetical protein
MAKFTLNLDGPLLKIPNEIAGAGFDHVGRYQLIGEIITRYAEGNKNWPKNILDVGGLGSFLDKVIKTPITILDEEATDHDMEAKGDGAHMTNVRDGAYDVVITSDTLEHVPQKDRKNFIKELIRASNDLVILCAPFSDHGAADEEEKLQGFFKGATGAPHRWLREHAEYVLPREKEIISYFKANGLEPIVVNQSSLEIWRHMLAVTLLSNDMASDNIHKKAEAVNRFYNRNLLFKDFSPKSYRTFIIASKKKQLDYDGKHPTMTADDSVRLAIHLSDFYSAVVAGAKEIPLVKAAFSKQSEQLHKLRLELAEVQRQHQHVTSSKTWRYTEPLRGGVRKIRKIVKG